MKDLIWLMAGSSTSSSKKSSKGKSRKSSRRKRREAKKRRRKLMLGASALLITIVSLFAMIFSEPSVDGVAIVPIQRLQPKEVGEYDPAEIDHMRNYWGSFEYEGTLVKAQSRNELFSGRQYCLAEVKSLSHNRVIYYAAIEPHKCDVN